jgi:hypothetical protein
MVQTWRALHTDPFRAGRPKLGRSLLTMPRRTVVSSPELYQWRRLPRRCDAYVVLDSCSAFVHSPPRCAGRPHRVVSVPRPSRVTVWPGPLPRICWCGGEHLVPQNVRCRRRARRRGEPAGPEHSFRHRSAAILLGLLSSIEAGANSRAARGWQVRRVGPTWVHQG